MAGGEPGEKGANYWHRQKPRTEGKEVEKGEKDYTVINLGGSNQCRMKAGDRIVIRE